MYDIYYNPVHCDFVLTCGLSHTLVGNSIVFCCLFSRKKTAEHACVIGESPLCKCV